MTPAASSPLPVFSSPLRPWLSANSSRALRNLGVAEVVVVIRRVLDYAERELVLPVNVKMALKGVDEEDQELEMEVEVRSWLPGEAGHDEVLTWAW